MEAGSALLLQRCARPRTAAMTLASLFAGLPVRSLTGDTERRIENLTIDSRRTAAGSVFFAMPGRRTDGDRFIEEAIHRGAVAVVSEHEVWTPPRVTRIIVADIRRTLAAVAARLHGQAHAALELTAITGTSGKTVVATLLRWLLEAQAPTGLLGTNHYALGRRTLPAGRTTPEPIELHGMLAQLRAAGVDRCLLEVSSHGIDQGRVAGLAFAVAAFLNLSPEHLDYHGDMEAYYAVISGFLRGAHDPAPRRLVLSADDPWCRRLRAAIDDPAGVLTFGLDPAAQVRATDIELGPRATRFRLVWPAGELRLVSPLVGSFNVHNVLAAFALGWAHGLDPVAMAGRLIDFEGVRGRLERVDRGQPFNVIVDYAHTVNAYAQVLAALREITPGRIITVFGCGGDRDRRPRPLLTRAVIAGSDLAIATADNPRGETLEAIFADMRAGVGPADPVSFIPDRREAIGRALALAQPGDTVLIAGKGHETFQEFGASVTPFDDRAVARELLDRQGPA
jgi:UDP-N-acetylmuramoyl-L-alanyl-D-glutamate--2,6-diaminopimelate ligase